jgi:RNA-directed DNA polymerase
VDRTTAHKFRCIVSRIVLEEGFVIHPDKIRLMGQGNRQTVTGVVVNQTLGLSRQERRRLRAMAHQLSRQNDDELSGLLHAKFQGKVAYLSMLNSQQALPFKSSIS